MKLKTISPRSIRFGIFALAAVAVMVTTEATSIAQQASWIWSPRSDVDQYQRAECYFRKKFTLVRPEKCQLFIAAGDRYQLFINGRLASEGESYGAPTELDVTSFLQPGVNLIAAKVEHIDGDLVGLAIKFRVKEKGEIRWRSLVTDGTWKSRIKEIETWKSTSLNDIGWLATKEIQPAYLTPTERERYSATVAQSKPVTAQPASVAKSSPASDEIQPVTSPAQPNTNLAQTNQDQTSPSSAQLTQNLPQATTKPAASEPVASQAVAADNSNELLERFEISNEFSVQQVMLDNETGSLIAMTFNEFGKLLLSVENGPLLIADPTKPLNDPTRIRVLCDAVKSCQGILALNGDVYVTGHGPQGSALYHLTDADKNGVMEPTNTLMKFEGDLGEHGPHGLILGNDGMLYVNVGNASWVQEEISPTSPYRHAYEGDLVARYEDPGGHAQGVKAPGGTIVRVSLDGTKIETVAGGIRNSYDLAFNRYGELFMHDSDMESDMGMSWYRPTKVFFVPEGAEMGWRSGWSKHPDYFADQTPSLFDTGRGSPTGAEIYQHLQFPARYHDSIFFADWSEGRILNVQVQPDGAGYKGNVEEFMSGRPMNVSDLAVGEDGALYFCTGGRGTSGGVYRVAWNGRVPQKMLQFNSDLEKIIRHPQPGSAWARQNIARLKQVMGDEKWNQAIVGVASETRNTVKYRIMAMDKMVLYGPFPEENTIRAFATDENVDIRAKAAQLCGLRAETHHVELLQELVGDKSARVRRVALESFMRLGETPSLESLLPIVQSADRIESLAGRRLLERIPVSQWSEQVLECDDINLFMNGALAMVTAEPSLENSYKVLARCSQFMEGLVGDDDFVTLLRVVQLALSQGNVDYSKIPAFANRIGNEFPSGNGKINRELSRIMAYLNVASLDDRMVAYFDSETDSDDDKLHVALYLQRIGTHLSGDERLALISYLEKSHDRVGGGSYKAYLARAIRDVADTMTTDQVKAVLANGGEWPNAVISAFYKMPRELDDELMDLVIKVDQDVSEKKREGSSQVRLGVIAILAQSGNPKAMDYLRTLWQNEPQRRGDIAIGLAQQPDGENWAYLISSLPVLDDLTSNEVLEKLATVNRRPRDPGHYRSVIELGYRLRANGSKNVSTLLEHWTGETIGPDTEDWTQVLTNWKNWFEQKYPEQPVIELKQNVKQGEYSTDQVLSFIEANGLGNANHGRILYTKAQCALCHRMGTDGTTAGPDLTSIARRFSTREIVEAIIHPSDIVSDQYRSMTILTEDGETFTGMATESSDGSWLVLQSDGKRVRIESDSIEDIKESDASSMPDRLLDSLSIQEVADLISYLDNGSSSQTKAQSNSDVR